MTTFKTPIRKFASIQRIVDLRPIHGADAIETARVLGWNVVVKKHEFFERGVFEEMIASLGLRTVPIVDEFTLDHTVGQLVEMSEAPSALNPKQTREGLVIRAVEETRDEDLGRLSCKVISPKFLLNGGD